MSAAGDAIEALFYKYIRRFPTIIAVKKRVCHAIALAATYRTPRQLLFLPRHLFIVRRRIRKIHKLWVLRLWMLSSNDLWLLQRGLDPSLELLEQDRLRRSFKRLANCISRNVVYNKYLLQFRKKRVCNKTNVCPHCWANSVAAQVHVVRKVINAQLKLYPDRLLRVSVVVMERNIPARIGGVNFAQPETIRQEILFLKHVLHNLQRVKSKLSNRARRCNPELVAGIMWRVVLIPKNDHWLLQFRTLCVHRLSEKRAHKLLVGKDLPDMTCVHSSLVSFPPGLSWRNRKNDDDGPDAENYAQLVEFNRYPVEMITEDIETTSAAINATTAVRMVGGIGAFRRVSTALVRERAIAQKEIDVKKRGPDAIAK